MYQTKMSGQCLGLIVTRLTIVGQVNKSTSACDVVGKESYPWHRDSFQEVCSLVVKASILEWESAESSVTGLECVLQADSGKTH